MKFSYYIIYPLAYLVGKLPFRIQFLLADLIRWVLYRVVKYRLKVVRENLRNAFPEKSEIERLDIEQKFYTHLSNVFLECITMASISRDEMRARTIFTNFDQVEQQTQGQSFIASLGHYGTWEYSSSYAMHTRHEAVYGVYRPLADKGMDQYFLKCRRRFGSEPVPMNDISKRVFQKRHSEQGVVIALIADQSPPKDDSVKWFTFLNQPTQFFMGIEKMALMFHLPVYFTRVQKHERGFYTLEFEQIYDGKESVQEFEITNRYVVRMEAMIRQQPELWMWSHRRWKHKPTVTQ